MKEGTNEMGTNSPSAEKKWSQKIAIRSSISLIPGWFLVPWNGSPTPLAQRLHRLGQVKTTMT